MGWIKIQSKDDIPKDYVDVLVLLGDKPDREIKVMRHEGGWWYGLPANVQPVAYFEDRDLSKRLKEAKTELYESDL